LAFVALASLVIVSPGADFAIVTRNTLSAGRTVGWATASGITISNVVQGLAAACGLGAVIVASQPVFYAIKWAGALYLFYLALSALRTALRGTYVHATAGETGPRRGFRQGFLTNITNPKVLVFYIAVLPQFIAQDAPLWALGALAVTHALISLAYLSVLVAAVDGVSRWLATTAARRALDLVTAAAFTALGFRLVAD
jgi:threonine/homoserine/homoserine lactone efflux protein